MMDPQPVSAKESLQYHLDAMVDLEDLTDEEFGIDEDSENDKDY